MDFSSQWERFSNSKEKGDIIVYMTQIFSNIFASFSIIFLVSKFANLLVCKREKTYILSKTGTFPFIYLICLIRKIICTGNANLENFLKASYGLFQKQTKRRRDIFLHMYHFYFCLVSD